MNNKKKYRDWFDRMKASDFADAPEKEVEAGIDRSQYRYSFSLILYNDKEIVNVIIRKFTQLLNNTPKVSDWTFSEQSVTENNNFRIDGLFNYEAESPEQVLLFVSALAKISCHRIGIEENTNRNLELRRCNEAGHEGCSMLTLFDRELQKWATLANTTPKDSTDESVTTTANWAQINGEMFCQSFNVPLEDIPGTKYLNKLVPYIWSIKNRRRLWQLRDKHGNWFRDIPVLIDAEWAKELSDPRVRIYGKDIFDLYHRFMVFFAAAYELNYNSFVTDKDGKVLESEQGFEEIVNMDLMSDYSDWMRGALVYKYRMNRIFLNGQVLDGRTDPEVKEIVKRIRQKRREHPEYPEKKLAIEMLTDYVRNLPDYTLHE